VTVASAVTRLDGCNCPRSLLERPIGGAAGVPEQLGSAGRRLRSWLIAWVRAATVRNWRHPAAPTTTRLSQYAENAVGRAAGSSSSGAMAVRPMPPYVPLPGGTGEACDGGMASVGDVEDGFPRWRRGDEAPAERRWQPVRSIRARLTTIVAVPTAALVVLSAVGVAAHASTYRAAGRTLSRVQLVLVAATSGTSCSGSAG
jgi:hypothetical protein